MKTLLDFLTLKQHNSFNDKLLNYSIEDFNDDGIIENLIENHNNVDSYLEYQFCPHIQGIRRDIYNKYQSLCYESIIKSYDTKKLANELNKHFGKSISKIDMIKTSDVINSIRIEFSDKTFNFDNAKYKSLLNLYNYYESSHILVSNYIVVTLSPYVSEDKTNDVYELSKGIVYHICPKYVTSKILEYGLRPKGGKNSKLYTNRLWHPKSIYVLYDEIDNDIIEYFKNEINNEQISNEYNKHKLDLNDIDILKIDLNKYNRKIRFYKDTLGDKKFVYTKEYIPPFCLSLYKKKNKLKTLIDELCHKINIIK